MDKNYPLSDILLPVVSIDEYEAKTGTEEDVLVFAFFLTDEKAAEDFAKFAERSKVDCLDVEKSDNPNIEGHYLVFVEMHRSRESLDLFIELLDEVERLTGKREWRASIYKLNINVPFDVDTIIRHVDVANSDAEVTSFLSLSKESFEVKNNILTFSGQNYQWYVVECDKYADIIDRNKVYMSIHPSNDETTLEQLLGKKYLVISTEKDQLIVQRTGDKLAIVLKRYE